MDSCERKETRQTHFFLRATKLYSYPLLSRMLCGCVGALSCRLYLVIHIAPPTAEVVAHNSNEHSAKQIQERLSETVESDIVNR